MSRSWSDTTWLQWISGTDGLLATALCFVAVRMLLWLIARRRPKTDDESAELQPRDSPSSANALAFYAFQPRWTSLDRFYKVYITRTALYGAWVGGQFHDETSVRVQLLGLGPLVTPVAAWATNRRRTLESMYDLLICNLESVPQQDRRNFVVRRLEIQTIRVTEGASWWTAWHDQGTLRLELSNGNALTLIVRGDKPAGNVGQQLAALGYSVEVRATEC